jgi:hypothetical protein
MANNMVRDCDSTKWSWTTDYNQQAIVKEK